MFWRPRKHWLDCIRQMKDWFPTMHVMYVIKTQYIDSECVEVQCGTESFYNNSIIIVINGCARTEARDPFGAKSKNHIIYVGRKKSRRRVYAKPRDRIQYPILLAVSDRRTVDSRIIVPMSKMSVTVFWAKLGIFRSSIRPKILLARSMCMG